MRRLLFALGLLAVLVWSCIWSSTTVSDTAFTVAATLESGASQKAYEQWNAAQSKLGALLMHEELDELDRLFDRVLQAEQDGALTEWSLDRAELLAGLRRLPELEYPSFKNLL